MVEDGNDKKTGVPHPSASQVIQEQKNILMLLKEPKTTESGPRSLYDHIAEVLNHLCIYYPDESLQRLEEVSYLIKAQTSKEDTVALEEFLRVHDKRSHSTPNAQVSKETSAQMAQI